MPVKACPNGKFRVGSGPCSFDSKEDAEKAYRGYLAKKYGTKESRQYGHDVPNNLGTEGDGAQVDTSNAKAEDQARMFQEEAETYSCECLKCHHVQQSEKHCMDIKCEKCGGAMRRKDRPGIGR